MKTEDLITFLSANVDQEPVGKRRASRSIALAALGSAMFVLAIVASVLGTRPDLVQHHSWPFLLIKTGFALSLAVIAVSYLSRSARPGGDRQTSIGLIILPFAAVGLLALANLVAAPTTHWDDLLIGDLWLECLIAIPVIAVGPFAAMIWIVRQTSAPTNLHRAGAFAGLAAGSVSAMGYAFHCVDDALPFVALWYGGTIAICTFAGALLGPRLLRW